MIYTITLNPAIDRLIFLKGQLEKRKNNRAQKVLYDIGGKGTHASYAISKLGVENLALGFAGIMNLLKFQQVLDDKEIAHRFITTDGSTRESVILIDPENQGSTMVTEPSFTVSAVDKEKLKNYLAVTLTPQDMVLVAGSTPEGFDLIDLAELLQLIKTKGCFLACDLSSEALKLAIDSGADFIKPNELELRELLSEKETIEEKLNEISAKVAVMIASRGDQGSICYFEGKQYQVIVPEVKEVNDTGAGDCFVGAFLATFYQTSDIEQSLMMASGCAASKVRYEDSCYFNLAEAKELKNKVRIKQQN
ncbi:1-phosphofructokinase family hexose kinase [Candidatus Enterococcus ferrettii]|uniref:Tagatose-6-phosphate kinase n=1 Tax=Candidatus Enterococcus ferrettii TaxID=2815324 RepID=A0ABV0EU59_9ENTE|nr:1-phosphofructokinase family hexose kinase [Enterococcus sp. 665A]MBO1339523.1 1-phosphofructokinase family hexose kinase [Enterococcus sp. 665A]